MASPSYEDAMRYHAEYRGDDVGTECYGDEFAKYLGSCELKVHVDWGPNRSKLYKMIMISSRSNTSVAGDETETVLHARITVHGIGRRPAMALLASNESEIDIPNDTNECTFPEISVSWKHNLGDDNGELYPEYLVTLTIDGPAGKVLQRVLHVVPPPIGSLNFALKDIIWAPGLFQGDTDRSKKVVDSIFAFEPKVQVYGTIQRRRGFGLELETVQMPPDCEGGCFTHQQQLQKAIETAREWHLSSMAAADADQVERANKIWDQFQLWSVSHDLYVENGAPPSRLDLYQRVEAHLSDSNEKSELSEDSRRELNNLILGGRVEMPPELLSCIPYDGLPATSLASPEYKSPPPPHELYHVFPPPSDGEDDASTAIRLFLDGILKNPAVSWSPVSVPTVSDIGQSATSLHVHVNINNENAWPRETIDQRGDLEATQSLLSVVFGWICFDRVVQCYFCKPNVWRDRSFAPMFTTGPEFGWVSGRSESVPEQIKLYNLHAWFRHAHSCFKSCREEKKGSGSLFEEVFNHEVLTETISRWNSLNLLSLKKYGTIEFRRMHATLDADFVSSWTWFCCGFVERFRDSSMFDRFLYPFINADSWETGLEKLADVQHYVTIEDLYDIMCDEDDRVLASTTLAALMCSKV